MRIELPQVGESVTQGLIGKWLKLVGDSIKKYDPLVEVVTDKISMEIPSPVTGVLTHILVKEGTIVPMGTIIAEIRVSSEDNLDQPEIASLVNIAGEADRIGTLLKNVAPVGPTGSGNLAHRDAESQPVSETTPRYSPAVQRLASKLGIDLRRIKGSGIAGRVTRKDVHMHLEASTAEKINPTETTDLEGERIPLTPIRRTIADNMVLSATTIPQAWSMVEVDVTTLVSLRERTKTEFKKREGSNLTYLAFILKAVAECLKSHPLVNSAWGGDSIILKRHINLGVAVATPEGLMVPVIKNADDRTVADLAKEVEKMIARARRGNLTVDDVSSGTFTVNNTGALGSIIGKPLINPPQAAIINTEAIVKRPMVVNETITIQSIMNLCLTFDHRILDGAEASAFLADLKQRLQKISSEEFL